MRSDIIVSEAKLVGSVRGLPEPRFEDLVLRNLLAPDTVASLDCRDVGDIRHVARSRAPSGPRRRTLLAALLSVPIVGGLLRSAVATVAESTTAARRAVIMARALSYDTSLAARAGAAVVLAVLFKQKHADAEKAADLATSAFKPLESLKVAGLPFRTLTTPFTDAAELEQIIDKEGIDALFLCDGLESELASIKDVTRRKKVLTTGTSDAQVRQGVSLAVVADGTKLTILVNLPQSKEEGATFGSDLLRVARVVR